jgi:hypothetical protein
MPASSSGLNNVILRPQIGFIAREVLSTARLRIRGLWLFVRFIRRKDHPPDFLSRVSYILLAMGDSNYTR